MEAAADRVKLPVQRVAGPHTFSHMLHANHGHPSMLLSALAAHVADKKVSLPALPLMILTQAHHTLAGNFSAYETSAPAQIPPNFHQHAAHIELQIQRMPTLDHLQTPETRIVYQSNGPSQRQQPTTLYTTGCEALCADQIHCPESLDTLKFPKGTLPHPPPHHPITTH
jgi:hypothetical protein